MKNLLKLIPTDIKDNLELKKYTKLDDTGQHIMTFTRNEQNEWTLSRIGDETDPEILRTFVNNVVGK